MSTCRLLFEFPDITLRWFCLCSQCQQLAGPLSINSVAVYTPLFSFGVALHAVSLSSVSVALWPCWSWRGRAFLVSISRCSVWILFVDLLCPLHVFVYNPLEKQESESKTFLFQLSENSKQCHSQDPQESMGVTVCPVVPSLGGG